MTRKRISCCLCTKTREYDYVSYEMQDSRRVVLLTSSLLTNVQVIKNTTKILKKNKLCKQLKRHLKLDLSKFNYTGKETEYLNKSEV